MGFCYRIILGALMLALMGLTPQLAYADTKPCNCDAVEEPQITGVVFKNVQIFDGISSKLSAPSDVLVVGNKISNIVDSGTPIPIPLNAQVTHIDGTDHVLMPGLIDNHVHIVMSASKLDQLLSPNVEPEILHFNATKEAEKMLMRGFTTVRDMGGPVFGLKKLIDTGKTPGPRIYPSGATISQTAGHGDFGALSERPRRFGGTLPRAEALGFSIIADGRDEVLTATRENLRLGASQIKLMAGGGVSSIYDPLDVLEYTSEELEAAVQAASDWGTYVSVHVYTPEGIKRAINAGVKSIEHGHLIDEDTMKLIGDNEIWLSTQIFDSLNEAQLTPDQLEKQKKVVEGTENVYKFALEYNKEHENDNEHEKHINLAWGTDFLFQPDETKNQNSYIAKLKNYEFSPFQALRMVTHDNADLLALSGERNPYPGKLGVIEVNAYADLLLVDGNPLEDLSVVENYTDKFKVIMKDGKIYQNLFSQPVKDSGAVGA